MAAGSELTPQVSVVEGQVLVEPQRLAGVDYTDGDGLQKRVALPPGNKAYEEGIPVSLDLDQLYGDCPLSFRKRLADELFARGLKEPTDFVRPGAAELVRAAVLGAVRRDALDIIGLARKVIGDA